MRAFLTTLDKSRIRNFGVGDWRYDDEHIYAMSASMDDPRCILAVQIHELIEAFGCRKDGITDKEVSAHDAMFEREREQGLHGPFDEPGDDPRAPYLLWHKKATEVERAVCKALEIEWEEHENTVNQLFETYHA